MPMTFPLGFIGTPSFAGSASATTTTTAGPFTPMFLDSDSDGAVRVSDPITFSGISFGTAAANRLLIAGIATGTNGDPNAAPTSVVIGGVSATLVVSRNQGEAGCSIWQALVPSGTSGTVVINFSPDDTNAVAFGLWSIKTNTQAATNSGGSTGGSSVAATVPSGGYGIVIYCADCDEQVTASDGVTPSNYTEDWDIVPNTSGTVGTLCNGGHITSSVTVDAAVSGASAVDQTLVYASWGP